MDNNAVMFSILFGSSLLSGLGVGYLIWGRKSHKIKASDILTKEAMQAPQKLAFHLEEANKQFKKLCKSMSYGE